jgi:hypothetical protein
VLAIGVVALILWSVIAGLMGREREVLARATAGLDEAGSLAGTRPPDTEQVVGFLGDLVRLLVSGLLRLPVHVGQQIMSDTVGSFRSYALGVTLIGLMNGVVIGLGAACLGSPWSCRSPWSTS